MRLIVLIVCCCLWMTASSTIQPAGAAYPANETSVFAKKSKKLSLKKQKRLKKKMARLQKKMQRKKSPGLWAVLSGLGSIALVIAAIGASFALSSTGALLGIIGAGLLGIAGLFFGFKAKNNGQGIGGWIGIIFGGLSLLAVLAMLIGAAIG